MSFFFFFRMLVVFEFFECLSLNACRLQILECLSSFLFRLLCRLVAGLFEVSPSRSVAISQCHAFQPPIPTLLCPTTPSLFVSPLPPLCFRQCPRFFFCVRYYRTSPTPLVAVPTFGDCIAAYVASSILPDTIRRPHPACPVLAVNPASILSSFTRH